MRRSAMALAIVAALASPAAAKAQSGAIVGDFGGGAVVAAPASPFAAGSIVLSLRADGSSNVRIDATLVGGCASGTFTATVPIAADGTFSAFGTVRQAATRMRYELRGTLTETPTGTATARFQRTVGNSTRRCSAEGVGWDARRRAAGTGTTAAIRPAATLFGLSDEARPRGVVLRTAADGRTISRALYGVTLRCSGGVSSPTFDLPRDDLAILPDGRVSDRETGTRRTTTSILKYVERFAATIGSAGAEGMYSVELTVRSRRTGKRQTRCRSGIVRWTASH
jgi:hypothetical protein